VLQYLREKKR